MEQNTPKFRLKLNLFDGIVLLAALAVAAFLLWNRFKPAPPPAEDAPPVVTSTLYYTVRFQSWAPGTSELIQPGDQLIDNIKNYNMGHVVSAEAVPARFQGLDQENRRFVWTELEDFEDVLVTIEASCVPGDGKLTIDGAYDVRVGNTVYLRGEGYMGSGPIVKIEEGQG